jgi:glycosyltransferase involved in cell wall biosynthesis
MRITHVVTDLERGGAQQMLLDLLRARDRADVEAEVVSLAPRGPLAARIEALGVRARSLGLRRTLPNPGAVVVLAAWLRRRRPDAVHAWLGHANLVAGLAARLAGRPPLIWGIHHTPLERAGTRASTRWTLAACRRLAARLPARIVSCSEAAARAHVADGYPVERMVVIPNGCDTAAFRPDPPSRAAVRRELGLPGDAVLIGQSARVHPQKDHATAVAAIGRLARRQVDVRLVCWGAGATPDNARLAGWMDAAGVRGRCHLLGEREDVSRLTAAMDLATSTSAYGEACPLVLLEAMSAGVPCVATDVGDARAMVGDTGLVVPPRDPAALAAAWSALLEAGAEARARLGEGARRRVLARFSLPAAAHAYRRLYGEVASAGSRPAAATPPPAVSRTASPRIPDLGHAAAADAPSRPGPPVR